ncbi:hypothetical protein KIH23_13515 [Flavobacterium sp. CYK-55]|uniref:hypothetical protein n=1 Tax=Flavobacterium sp. CYK-55 TaxID=2835529 RepID=UPI001BCE360E|nr:hypothetical protein [Flavobacterium sp. CYK-55]MBS7788321.1 hypothetical protein [Flavobacterium sp. CYK-55]
MKQNQKFTPFIVLTLLYIISILPIIYLTILLLGKADNVLVICYGILNTIFLLRYYKRNILLSLLIGFLIPSFTLCLIYSLWFLGISSKSLFPTIFFVIASVSLCFFLSKNHSKIESRKGITLILLVPTLIILICSLNLKETYPTKTENENLTNAEIKIVDKKNNPKFGAEIKVRVFRQPLFGLRESHEVYKTTTSENGISKVQLSKNSNYQLTIKTKENKLIFFDIDSADLIKKKTFVIEE